jgi:NOL1/NOP2/sun family putative RNA methylase
MPIKRFHGNILDGAHSPLIAMSREDFIELYQSLGATVTGNEFTPKAIRVNPLSTDESTLVETLTSQGVELEKIPFLDHGYKIISSPFSLGASIEYLLGHYFLQETASQLPTQILSPSGEDTVLDMTSAPGGKTTQMAAYMGNGGSITAIDMNRRRLYALENNLERMGVRNTVVYNMNALDLPDKPMFTKVLLDAPCSGNYVTDSRWFGKRKKSHITHNFMVQRKLLTKALSLLEKGGTLLYATCSLEPEENELNIQWLLENHEVRLEDMDAPGTPGVTEIFGDQLDESIKKCRRLWPNDVGTQGFFLARAVKL